MPEVMNNCCVDASTVPDAPKSPVETEMVKLGNALAAVQTDVNVLHGRLGKVLREHDVPTTQTTEVTPCGCEMVNWFRCTTESLWLVHADLDGILSRLEV